MFLAKAQIKVIQILQYEIRNLQRGLGKSPLAGMISHSVAAFGTPRLLIHCLYLPQIALIEVALFETV